MDNLYLCNYSCSVDYSLESSFTVHEFSITHPPSSLKKTVIYRQVITSQLDTSICEPKFSSGWWLTKPLWKIWVRQLEWLFPIYGKIKNSCSSHHQPIISDLVPSFSVKKTTPWGHGLHPRPAGRRSAPLAPLAPVLQVALVPGMKMGLGS